MLTHPELLADYVFAYQVNRYVLVLVRRDLMLDRPPTIPAGAKARILDEHARKSLLRHFGVE